MQCCGFVFYLSTAAGIIEHVYASSTPNFNCSFLSLCREKVFIPLVLKTHIMKWPIFYETFINFFVFNLNWLTLLQFLAYPCAIELAEARQQCCTEESGRKLKELEWMKSTHAHRTRSPSPKKELEMEFNETTWQTALILCTAWVDKPGRSRVLFGLPLLPLSLCSSVGVQMSFYHIA